LRECCAMTPGCVSGVRRSSSAFATVRRAMGEIETLLPYRSGSGAWIAKGATKLSWSTLGEVSIGDGVLSLVAGAGVIAAAPVGGVSVHRVPIWFGMGVRLDMAGAGRWYVQPRWSPRSIRTARRATRVFRQALVEAQRS
jgi:hypothetical protein